MDIQTTLECESFMGWVDASLPSASQVMVELEFLSMEVMEDRYAPKALDQIVKALQLTHYREYEGVIEALQICEQILDDIGALS